MKHLDPQWGDALVPIASGMSAEHWRWLCGFLAKSAPRCVAQDTGITLVYAKLFRRKETRS